MHIIQNIKQLLLLLFLITLFVGSSPAWAETLTLPSEQDINLDIFFDTNTEKQSTDTQYELLWLHSERGVSNQLKENLKNINTQTGLKVILPDFHDSYFIPISRSSLEKIPQQDIEDLIKQLSQPASNKKFFIFAHSRAASLLLNALHHLQSENSSFQKTIAGIIFLGPYLQEQTPKIGQLARYQTIASYSNLPLYVFQAERSPRLVPLPNLVKQLEKGGSSIFVHILKNIHGGFLQRDKADLTEADKNGLNAFTKQLLNALSLLEDTEAAVLKPLSSYTKNIRKKPSSALQEVTFLTPSLRLPDLNGKPYSLSDYQGKVVIASFWASWCRPCLEEIPSLVSLKKEHHKTLEILGVNIREEKETIKHFTKGMNINFPLLQDMSSKMVKDWKVYVYPSNFIIDKKGIVRYAATGAMDWQDKEVNGILKKLINEN